MTSETCSKSELPALTDELVRSYSDIGAINCCSLPSIDATIGIVRDLKEVLFPGYRRHQNLHWDNVTYHVGGLIDSLHDRLAEQIERALRHQAQVDPVADQEADFHASADAITLRFLKTLPRMRLLLSSDAQAAFDSDPAARSVDEIIFCYPGLEAIAVYRLAHELHTLRVPLIPRAMTEHAHSLTGIDIHPGAKIGPCFFIDHGTGVVIGETCEIARNVTLYQGVTLGALSFAQDEAGNLIRNSKRHPTIEENVVIYANATVLGGGTIVGANSVIGASVSLTRSVPRNTVVTIEKPSLRFRAAS